ncbi:nucleotidyltransferase family protein [Granulicella sp. WH15]|nr:nucleotidyltransferase family protein [Granulicella sp. WH15]QHN05434.1 nucleotidyltransferase family protein [Granulicella sp. WH15]
MQRLHTNTESYPLSHAQQLREAALLIFCDPMPAECERLRNLSSRKWQSLLTWLDTSGTSLYFLDRLTQVERCDVLPPVVLARLQQNLFDNTERTGGMIAESTAIQLGFQNAGLSYAALKGFSLWPLSVPRPELRSQLDLDFLISARNAPEARRILEGRGFRLKAISGRSWEFKSSEPGKASLKDLYKPTSHRCVELHLEADDLGEASLLARTEKLYFHGVFMPVLHPVDLFLGQGMHLYKHVCGEFWRTAHLIEFRRHVLARYHDRGFWRELRKLAEDNLRASVGLGVIALLTSQTMGDFAPEEFTCWTVDRLPVRIRLWVERYGRRSVVASHPGDKLYLLLQQELERVGLTAKRSLRQALLPRRLPPAIAHGSSNESLLARLVRYRRQVYFVLFRLRFHLVEGLRYLWESIRWRQYVDRLDR